MATMAGAQLFGEAAKMQVDPIPLSGGALRRKAEQIFAASADIGESIRNMGTE